VEKEAKKAAKVAKFEAKKDKLVNWYREEILIVLESYSRSRNRVKES
jgi:hypothetical protein